MPRVRAEGAGGGFDEVAGAERLTLLGAYQRRERLRSFRAADPPSGAGWSSLLTPRLSLLSISHIKGADDSSQGSPDGCEWQSEMAHLPYYDCG